MPLHTPAPNAASADRLIFRPTAGPAGDVLVAVFLRGGMDAIYTIPPFGDRAFQLQRHGFGPLEPGSKHSANGLINLDDYFGLHPHFAPLESLYRQKLMAIVHAVGLEEPILSHFDASRAIERGATGKQIATGWIGRHLAADAAGISSTAPGSNPSPLRAVAMGHGIPLALHGAEAQSLDSLGDYRLEVPAGWDPGFSRVLRTLYAGGADLASTAGRQTFDTIAVLQRLAKSRYQSANSAIYPFDTFGNHLSQVAQLIKADVGLEAAVLDLSDWDSHASQIDFLVPPMQSLALGLQAFAQDMGEQMRRVLVVAMSEFGRRVQPNDSAGTDHGRGSAMLVVGGGVHGGKVYGRWPGLAAHDLDVQGNLRVTTDYRDVLAEIVDRRLKNPAIDRVFPGLKPKYLNFTAT
ncbi:MAG TPA: DUF1501 domain-containing protein [Pirellulales bacterium]|jgi:uncharacterized protein (DUF1501 family)|nr:DUF1501 domain-containing protein [Pirellulales bacterium]